MRTPLLLSLLMASMFACGNDDEVTPDGSPGSHPPPRVIPGGGIGDGPIDGVANLYVIDDATREPIAGAAVRVGSIDGTTDATGLFVAEGLVGPQTVIAKAGSYRTEVWIGANGANLTMNLAKADPGAPESGVVQGQITGFSSITVPAGHAKDAIILYAQTGDLGDRANELPNTLNACFGRIGNQDCTYTLTSRTGTVALVAAILDRDLNGTPAMPADDTLTVIGWATRRDVTVTAGTAPQTGIDLAPLTASALQTVTVDFAGAPALANLAALLGIDLGDEGVLQLPALATPAAPSLLVPRPEALGAAGYRLTAIASDAEPPTEQAVVLRRGLTGTRLATGDWVAAPTGVSIDRGGASWNAVAGATVYSVEYTSGTTRALTVTVLDGSTEVALPDLVTLPSGSLQGAVNAIGAPGLDVTNFALDTEEDKLAQVGNRIVQIE